MPRSTVPLFALEANAYGAPSDLIDAAEKTVQALRDQHVIEQWHELDCAIVIEAARGVAIARGVAKAQMMTALLAARAKLPEPMTSAETDDEWTSILAERGREWLALHPADLSDQTIT